MSGGIGIRTIFPSLLGVSPRSEAWIAFSIAWSALRSYGEITIKRGSGALMFAIWFSGVGVP